MARRNFSKKASGFSDSKFVKEALECDRISVSEFSSLLQIDYPLFSFKYLSKSSMEDCDDPSFFCSFLMRLRKLSELGWKEIMKSSRHSFGMEKIPVSKIKKQLPAFLSPDVEELTVFRASGNNLPFIGLRQDKVFHVFFIEARFGDIYEHC